MSDRAKRTKRPVCPTKSQGTQSLGQSFLSGLSRNQRRRLASPSVLIVNAQRGDTVSRLGETCITVCGNGTPKHLLLSWDTRSICCCLALCLKGLSCCQVVEGRCGQCDLSQEHRISSSAAKIPTQSAMRAAVNLKSPRCLLRVREEGKGEGNPATASGTLAEMLNGIHLLNKRQLERDQDPRKQFVPCNEGID